MEFDLLVLPSLTGRPVQGTVSMAGAGASSVAGGNRRIFDSFAKRSNANVHLNTRVRSIEKLAESPLGAEDMGRNEPNWLLRYENVQGGQTTTRAYDAIIFAAPLHKPPAATGSKIAFVNCRFPELVPELPYVQLHVTMVVTNATVPKSAFLNVKEPAPATIMATFESYVAGKAKVRPRINSLNYLSKLGKVKGAEGDSHIVKRR